MLNLLSSSSFCFPKKIEKQNQDAILPARKVGSGYLMAVADGVGSYRGSELASLIAIEELEKISTEIEFDEKKNLIVDIVNNSIFNLGKKDKNLESAATTLTFGYLTASGLYVGHIGDCRLYVRIGKKLKLLTTDHTQYRKLLDEKIYTKKELNNMNIKNILYSAISPNVEKIFQQFFIPIENLLTDSDTIDLYIMSDGAYSFWEERPRFSEGTMRNVNKFTTSIQRRIERKGAKDDYSLVGVSVKYG